MLARALMSAAVSVVVLSGCNVDNAVNNGPNPLVGAWTYRAVQSVPVAATVDGTLTIEGDMASDFSAGLQGIERDAMGVAEAIAIVGSGRLVAGTTLDLTLAFGSGARRHIGSVRGDSVSGAWSTNDVPARSGTFEAVRQ